MTHLSQSSVSAPQENTSCCPILHQLWTSVANCFRFLAACLHNIASRIHNAVFGRVFSAERPEDEAQPLDPSRVTAAPSSSRQSAQSSQSAQSVAMSTLQGQEVPGVRSSVADRFRHFSSSWNPEIEDFQFPRGDFKLNDFLTVLRAHAAQFTKPDINYTQHFGYIDRVDLNPDENPVVYVRADLHGDLKSLLENLRTLQEEGHLDENFRCRPGVHLLFLGDYCDRGSYGTQILEMLARLQMENPDQVHLIRGNHEDLLINGMYSAEDAGLTACLNDNNARAVLRTFYETMSLSTYLALDQEGSKEYIHGTHGTFELSMDPAELLDDSSTSHIPVPRQRRLSQRVQRLNEAALARGEDFDFAAAIDATDNETEKQRLRMERAAKRIANLAPRLAYLDYDITMYNWGDVSGTYTHLGSLGSRNNKLNLETIRDYQLLSSEQHRVELLFRGHEHGFAQLAEEDGTVRVTTLPVGMDSCRRYRSNFYGQSDRAYILRPAPQALDWQKQAILRAPGHNRTDEITEAMPIAAGDQ